jgi:hypothetical protein
MALSGAARAFLTDFRSRFRLVKTDLCTKFGRIAKDRPPSRDHCYQTNSDCNLLIYNDFEICFFYGQFNEGLDFQGFGDTQGNISTKLSTEIMNPDQFAYESKT